MKNFINDDFNEKINKIKPMSDSYWKKEDKFLKKRIKENQEIDDLIKMSEDKYKTKFNL